MVDKEACKVECPNCRSVLSPFCMAEHVRSGECKELRENRMRYVADGRLWCEASGCFEGEEGEE